MLRLISLAALLLAVAPLSQAADNGIYLGAGYAQSDYGLSDPGDIEDFDDEDGGFKVIAGFRAHDNFGVELNYTDHGDATAPAGDCGGVACPPGTAAAVGAETIAGYAVGFLALPVVDLFAKVGGASWQLDGQHTGHRFRHRRERIRVRLGCRRAGALRQSRRAARVRERQGPGRGPRDDFTVVYLYVPLRSALTPTR